MAEKHSFVTLDMIADVPAQEMIQRARDFYQMIKRRRTVRDFSDRAVPREVIDDCLLAAGTAPNGANQQPWHFAVVSSPEIKSEIRRAAEQEEREFYHGRAPQEWLDAGPAGHGRTQTVS